MQFVFLSVARAVEHRRRLFILVYGFACTKRYSNREYYLEDLPNWVFPNAFISPHKKKNYDWIEKIELQKCRKS